MSEPQVSVLVTVYNRERFLAECLHSIAASTFADVEIIVVDDASTDDSANIAEEWAARDARVRAVRNSANLGDYGNRMRAAELARGKYLKYVDSDDLIYPHCLEVMVAAMESYPDAAIGLSHSRPEEKEPYPWMLEPHDAWVKEFLGDGCMGTGPTGAIIRRQSFLAIGGFRKRGVLSDTDLWYRMSSRWPIVLLPPGLVWWRRHEGQEFTSGGASDVYLEDGFRLVEETLATTDSPLSADERVRAKARMRQRHARRILSLALKGKNPAKAVELFRRSGLSASEMLRGFEHYH